MKPQPVTSYRIRDLDPDLDYPALSALCTTTEAVDHLDVDTSETALRAAGPERRRWVAECTDAPGQFLAHGWLHPQTSSRWYYFTGVHPEWRRQGLGSALFEYGLTRARDLKVQQLAAYIRSDSQAADGFLRHHGFRAMGHNRFMKTTASLSREAPHLPEGFTVHTLAEMGDVEVLAEAHNLCYSDHWGHYENSASMTAVKLQEFMRDYPDSFIPEGIFLLFAPDGQIAGLTYGRLSADHGLDAPKTRIVDSPGVVSAFRHLDLLRPLTLLTLQWLRTQGDGSLELHCFGENDATVSIYTDLGFTLTPRDHWIEYMRPLE